MIHTNEMQTPAYAACTHICMCNVLLCRGWPPLPDKANTRNGLQTSEIKASDGKARRGIRPTRAAPLGKNQNKLPSRFDRGIAHTDYPAQPKPSSEPTHAVCAGGCVSHWSRGRGCMMGLALTNCVAIDVTMFHTHVWNSGGCIRLR